MNTYVEYEFKQYYDLEELFGYGQISISDLSEEQKEHIKKLLISFNRGKFVEENYKENGLYYKYFVEILMKDNIIPYETLIVYLEAEEFYFLKYGDEPEVEDYELNILCKKYNVKRTIYRKAPYQYNKMLSDNRKGTEDDSDYVYENESEDEDDF